MTGYQIIKFVEQVLIDDRIQTEQQLNLINMAIMDVSLHAPYVDIGDIPFTANNKTADLPSRCRSMGKLGNLKYIDPIKIVDLSIKGEPSNYYYQGLNKISVWPVPTEDKTYPAIFYCGYPELENLGDEPQILPKEFHSMLCYYIAWKTHDYFGNNLITDQKSSMFQEYFRLVGELKQMVDSNFYEYDSVGTKDVLPKSKHWLVGGE